MPIETKIFKPTIVDEIFSFQREGKRLVFQYFNENEYSNLPPGEIKFLSDLARVCKYGRYI